MTSAAEIAAYQTARARYRSGLRNCGCCDQADLGDFQAGTMRTDGQIQPAFDKKPIAATPLSNGGMAPGDRGEVAGGYVDTMPRVARAGTRQPIYGDSALQLSALLAACYFPPADEAHEVPEEAEFGPYDPNSRGWVWLKTQQDLISIPLPMTQQTLSELIEASGSFRHEQVSPTQFIVQISGSLYPIDASLVHYSVNFYAQPSEVIRLSDPDYFRTTWDFFTILIESGTVTRLEATRRGTSQDSTRFQYSSFWDDYRPYLLTDRLPSLYVDAIGLNATSEDYARSTIYQGKLYQLGQPEARADETLPGGASSATVVGNFFADSPTLFTIKGGSAPATALKIDLDELKLNKKITNAWVGLRRWHDWINDTFLAGNISDVGRSFGCSFVLIGGLRNNNNVGWNILLRVTSLRAFEQ